MFAEVPLDGLTLLHGFAIDVFMLPLDGLICFTVMQVGVFAIEGLCRASRNAVCHWMGIYCCMGFSLMCLYPGMPCMPCMHVTCVNYTRDL